MAKIVTDGQHCRLQYQFGRRDLSAVRHECDTEQILGASAYQQKSIWRECMYDVTLPKSLNQSTNVCSYRWRKRAEII